MAAMVEDFSELLCHGGMKGKAAGKAEHQQSGFCGFKSKVERGFPGWGGRKSALIEMLVEWKWGGLKSSPLHLPILRLLWELPLPQTHRPSFSASSQGGVVMCQER